MNIFGLTGKTGAGKSTVSLLLKEKGFYIIDGDILARSVTEKGSKALTELADAFGKDIILSDGSLDRKLLLKRVTQTEKGTDILNSITHPEIDKLIVDEIEKAKSEGFENCIIDAAALLESPSRKHCDKMIVVTAPPEARLQRIILRDSISEEAALLRMSMQKDDEYYLSKADIIIRNYSPYSPEEEIKKIG